ncbi:hypothetical protein E3C22_12820 [Jiella endophytica]|uniref:WbqC family protein n=1 Tax=Jiella endophytica TaxID=2558362 RepID=A0A4Y8RLG7_9HYPH|nr:WbqC family protein [Jiella endophytica]TFF23301.1 hypothetical protein E3C22_12820 [Jiella endophytica]
MPRRIAIMQPYLFPYLGYFQLARKVDEFWLLDTVPFIEQGWMNRNTLRAGAERGLFTLPVAAAAHDAPISQRRFHPKARAALTKLHRRIEQGYARAPHRNRALGLVASVAAAFEHLDLDFTRLTEFALARSFEILAVGAPIRRISELRLDPALTGQDRIIAACREIGTSEYLNMEGGRQLYDGRSFADAGIRLLFLAPDLLPYDQNGASFLPGLSVLDAIAHADGEELRRLVDAGRMSDAASFG